MSSISRHEINKYIQIFKQDTNFSQLVLEAENITLSDEKYRELVLLLLDNREIISNGTIDELNLRNPPFLRQQISAVLGKSFIKSSSYRQTLYTFKYSTLKTFFRDNWKTFVPDYDALNIIQSDQKRIFQEALMSEFDKFAETIDEIYNIQDIDRVPDQYLSYLAQAIGYEREDSDFLFDASFRELIKNIIEIYKIKGTNFSFELFFSFLGFDAEIREFWFDKRFADPGVSINPFTGVTDRALFQFYLSTRRPTEYIPAEMNSPYAVNEDKITETLDGNEFGFLSGSGAYTPNELMGLTPSDWATPFTFFKTNVIQFNLTRFDADEVSDVEGEVGQEELTGGLSQEDLEIIRIYANFLTPIFIQKSIVILTRPFVEDASDIYISDASRRDPRAVSPVIDKETMFHMYSGRQPTGYYFEDGTRYYADPIPNPLFPRWSGKDIEPGGHFISGYYNDTYKKIFDPNNAGSVYQDLQSKNPEWEQKEIFEEMKRLLSNGNLFKNYDLFDRDLMHPLIDDRFFYPFITKLIESDFGIGTYRKFSSKERKGKSYYDSYNKQSFYVNPEYAPNKYNRAKINKIIADNGEGKAELILNDPRRLFCNFKNFDKIQFEERLFGDFVKGDYTIRNIEYNREVAPTWSPNYYYVGDLIRDPQNDNVLYCIEEHDASADGAISAQFFKWGNVSGIDNLSVGLIFKLPETLFNYKILRMNVAEKSITLNKPLTKNATEKKFKVYNVHHNFIEIKSSVFIPNDGIYNVQGSESFLEDGLYYTKITLNNVLKEDQNEPGGFMFLNFEQRRMEERIPFLFNEFEAERNFIGDSETHHKEDINHLMPMLFEVYNRYNKLNALEPYPMGTPYVNYSDWPKGGIFQTTNILGEDVPTLFDEQPDLQEETIKKSVEEQGKTNIEVPNTFYNKKPQEIRGLFFVPNQNEGFETIRSSYKTYNSTHQHNFYLDFLEMEFYKEIIKLFKFIYKDEFYNLVDKSFFMQMAFEEKTEQLIMQGVYEHFIENYLEEKLEELKDDSKFIKLRIFSRDALTSLKEKFVKQGTIFTFKELFIELFEYYKKDINQTLEEKLAKLNENETNHYDTERKEDYGLEIITFYDTAEKQEPISGVQILDDKFIKMSYAYYLTTTMEKYYFDFLEMRAKTKFEDEVYAVGDVGPAGGFIFYINPNEEDDWTYIEVGPEETETTLPWGEGGVAAARNSQIGAGKTNTEAIVNARGEGSYAAYYCYSLEYYNPTEDYDFADWYLPSRNELEIIYNIISSGGLDIGVYWTSTEINLLNSYGRNLETGTESNTGKTNNLLVRPIRYF